MTRAETSGTVTWDSGKLANSRTARSQKSLQKLARPSFLVECHQVLKLLSQRRNKSPYVVTNCWRLKLLRTWWSRYKQAAKDWLPKWCSFFLGPERVSRSSRMAIFALACVFWPLYFPWEKCRPTGSLNCVFFLFWENCLVIYLRLMLVWFF